MADAEQAARPAGDDPQRCGLAAHGGACDEPMAEGADRCVFHLVEQVRRLQTYSQWASEQMDQLRAAHVGQRDGGAARKAAVDFAAGADVPPTGERDVQARIVDGGAGGDDTAPPTAVEIVDAMEAARAAADPRAGADTVRWMHDHTIVAAYDGGTGETREVGQAVGRYDHPTYVIRLADGSRFVWSEQLVREATEDERATYAAVRESVRVLNQADQGSGGSVPRAPVEALLAALDANGAGPHVMAAADAVRRHLDGDTT